MPTDERTVERNLTKQDVEMLKEAFKNWDIEARSKLFSWGIAIGVSVGMCLFAIIVCVAMALGLAQRILGW